MLEIIDEFIPPSASKAAPESETSEKPGATPMQPEVKREAFAEPAREVVPVSAPVFAPTPEAKGEPPAFAEPQAMVTTVVPAEPPQAFVPTPAPSAPIAPPPVVAPPISAPAPIEPPAMPTMAAVPTPASSEVITACLAQLIENRPAARPKLVIIGREGAQVSPMLRHLLGSESSLRKMESAVFKYLEIGERKVQTQLFEIIGISMEKQFSRLLDAAGADLIGCIVVVEAHRKEGLEYLSYLLNMLKTVYRRPLGIAVIKSAEQKNMATETLRDLLNLAPADFVQECPTTDRAAVVEFLKGFTSEGNLQRWALVGK
jgi:hypothetical protein